MFDLAELYAAWTEDSASFWARDDDDSRVLQERLTIDPEAILNEDFWGEVLSSACPPPGEREEDAYTWLVMVLNGLRTWSQRAIQPSLPQEEVAICHEALEKLLFLSRLHLARLDAELGEIQPTSRRTTKLGSIGEQTQKLLDGISRTIQGGISVVFPATESAKRSSLALLYLEPTCRLLQHEIVTKDSVLVKEIVRVLSLAVKLQHQQAMVRTQLIQLLVYYEHAVPVTAQLLSTLQKQFDHTALAELVVRDLVSDALEWTDSQNSTTISRAKCVNSFLQHLTQEMPELVAANLASISQLISSPVVQLRQAVLDIAAPLIHCILSSDEGDSSGTPTTNNDDLDEETGMRFPVQRLSGLALTGGDRGHSGSGEHGSEHGDEPGVNLDAEAGPHRFKPAFDLVKLVELRVNDLSHFCRLRAVQVLSSVARETAFISRRHKFTEIAITKMKDRTQLVRRQAMRLMKQLIDSHPQIMHPNCLTRSVWQSSLAQIEHQLEETELGDTRQQLEAAYAFVSFTLKFIDSVDEAVLVAQTLLLSRSKSDVLDAIDLLIYADAYGVDSSAAGIRAIVHLVWAKADNDEGNTVCEAAVNTYRDLFMTAPPELDVKRGAQLIAENLIALTDGSTQGELTSLERLLVIAVEKNMISVPVVGRLWGIYQTHLTISPTKRRGAAIILSMLAAADRSIACSGISAVIDIGLSGLGIADPELAAYSFAIMKRSIEVDFGAQRLPPTYDLFDKIVDFLLLPTNPSAAMTWTSTAKEALAAINAMCDCPPKVYTRLIRSYVSHVFGENTNLHTDDERMQLFGQLLFIVGEVALNLLVYLERSELEFKRRLHADASKESQSGDQNGQGTSEADKEEELMAGGGSREDDFQDVIRDIREEGILYSDKALLKPFMATVVDICKRELENSSVNVDVEDELASDRQVILKPDPDSRKPPQSDTTFRDQERLLVISATQTLSKFMCVSSHFCEDNLPLLVDLMGKHKSNVVRSNFVVALGDVAICFNRLIDEHTEYIYDRLNDRDPQVQRTCIVALIFLILAGQIKVKGKLGEMAKAVANPNRKISSLATMFFRELSTKENAIYNSFLDMLSTLISDTSLNEPDMLRILKFLSEFIDRERHMKQITDKLLARLPRCETQRQWNAYAQVLKSMPRKLDDSIKEILAAGFRNSEGRHDITSDEIMNEEEAQQEEELRANQEQTETGEYQAREGNTEIMGMAIS